MAKADQIKKLVASYGRSKEFRAVTLRIIDDAHKQGKKPFADALRRILEANVRSDYQASAHGLTSLGTQIDPAS